MLRQALVLLLLAGSNNPQSATSGESAATQELAPGVHLIPGSVSRGRQPDGNTVVFGGPAGLVIVDTGRHPEHVAQIFALAGRLGAVPRAIVNTHWHLDHTGGNVLLRQRYPEVRVYASDALRAARTGFLARYRTQLASALASPAVKGEEATALRAEMALIDAGGRLAPDEVITNTGERTLAGRRLLVGLESRAATAGDVWILDPTTRILAAGDLVTLPVPFLDTACPQGWKIALEHLSQQRFLLLVPGHGRALTRAEFATYRQAFSDLLACAGSKRSDEECSGGWLTAVGNLGGSGDPGYDRLLMDYYLKSVLRGDPKSVAAACAG